MHLPDRQIQTLLAAVIAFNILPHTLQQSPWLIATSVLFLLWSLLHLYRGVRLPNKWLRSALAIGGLVAVYVQWDTIIGQEPATDLLVFLAALKLLETTRYRDVMLVILTSYFLLMAYLLTNQSLLATLYMAADVMLITSLMFQLHKTDRRASLRSFRPVMNLLAVAFPVWIFLFIVFPRFSTGFWNFKSANANQTGFSDDLDPGSVEKLLQTDEVAFRVVFNGPIHMSPEDLYWRGGVLFFAKKALSWTRSGYSSLSNADERKFSSAQFAGSDLDRPLNYDVYLEPNFKKWLFVLDTPTNVEFDDPFKNSQISHKNGFTFETTRDVVSRTIYHATSTRRAPQQKMSENRRALYLQLPNDISPRIQKLAEKLKSETDGQTESIVKRVLQYYDDEKFVYTREPGALKTGAFDEFLFESKRGFCEHYAASFATLMRLMNIPARVVIGFLGGEANGVSRYFIVRNLDAHAWAEIWNERESRWQRVDPTAMIAPARLQMGGLYLEQDRIANSFYGRSPLYQLQRKLELSWDAAAMEWNKFLLGYDFTYQQQLFEKFGLKQTSRLIFFIWCSLGLIVFGFVLQLSLKRKASREEPLLAAYHELCSKLEKSGLPREANEGPLSYFARVKNFVPKNEASLEKLEQEFIALRYGKVPDTKHGEGLARVKKFRKQVRKLNFSRAPESRP